MIDRPRSSPEWNGAAIRIGAVSYLNSRPLIRGLDGRTSADNLILDVPSRLADALAAEALDVALIPTVEAFSNPDYEIVSDACVATHGPVLSVKLYSRVHPGEIKTLALDEGSRTSAALTQILLADRYGVHPELEKLPLANDISDTNADAVLMIGDRAIEPPAEQFHTVWDLGETWVEWTGLPFVFAAWVKRRGVDLQGADSRLSAARDRGLEEIETIAQEGADQLNLSYDTSLNYLTKNLYFRLGSAERAGLTLFQELATSHGFANPKTSPTPVFANS